MLFILYNNLQGLINLFIFKKGITKRKKKKKLTKNKKIKKV